MRSQRFGIEIEMTGITRAMAAKVLAGHFHTRATHVGGVYDVYSIRDDQRRRWKVVGDSSIRAEVRKGSGDESDYKVEFVSPICRYEDMESLQEITRKLRAAGAKVNDSCGIHVHVDASAHNVKTLRNIVNIMAAKEDLLYKALKVSVAREYYCQKADLQFLNDLNDERPKTMYAFEHIWYRGYGDRYDHYDSSRYHGLNLHSVFSKGTIEFRLFNSTLHAGEVKSYIQLSLAISHQALVQKSASRTKTQSNNEKYTFRTWLLRLGLIGDEFKTVRYHLLKNLDGNIAWRDPMQAQKQKERLAAKRLAETTVRNTAQDFIYEDCSEESAEGESDHEETDDFVVSM